MNLTELEELAKAATPGPWQQGRTLLTNITRLWTYTQRHASDSYEYRLVCANFTEQDEGRSRIKVSITDTDSDAAYIAAANPKTILALTGLIRQMGEILGLVDSLSLEKNFYIVGLEEAIAAYKQMMKGG